LGLRELVPAVATNLHLAAVLALARGWIFIR